MPRAVQYESFGPPNVLDVVDVPEIHPKAGQVRVAVKGAALNPFDFKVRSGLVPSIPAVFPRGIGSDFAGVVDELPEEGAVYFDGAPIALGDEVFGWGTSAVREQLAVPSANLSRKPAGVSWVLAASLSVPVHAAHFSLETLPVGAGDTVLLSAAAGAVGIVYAQIAVARGAKVIGTASEGNFALLESLGVIPTIYGPGLVDRVRTLAPEGITAVQDNFGRETVDAGLELGVPASRICSIVDEAGIAELGIIGPGQHARSAELMQRYVAMVADGHLVLPIQQVFPIGMVREAFELLEGRHVSGKIVIALTAVDI
jgi:NADPH:quinone reductase-like Zn-dependent oxidoreductase